MKKQLSIKKIGEIVWSGIALPSKTKTEAEDVIISALADVGVEGVEIQDKQPLTETDKEQMFVDIMPEGPADDGIAYLNFYLEEDTETAPVLERVRAVLEEVRGYMDIGEGTITESQNRGQGLDQ